MWQFTTWIFLEEAAWPWAIGGTGDALQLCHGLLQWHWVPFTFQEQGRVCWRGQECWRRPQLSYHVLKSVRCQNRLHDVEPLEGLEMLPPAQLSRLVAAKALRTVPYPLLGENTLVISDSIILAPDDTGRLALMVRCVWTCSNVVCVNCGSKTVMWTLAQLPTLAGDVSGSRLVHQVLAKMPFMALFWYTYLRNL